MPGLLTRYHLAAVSLRAADGRGALDGRGLSRLLAAMTPFPRRRPLSFRQRPQATLCRLRFGFEPVQAAVRCVFLVNPGVPAANQFGVHVAPINVDAANSAPVTVARLLAHGCHLSENKARQRLFRGEVVRLPFSGVSISASRTLIARRSTGTVNSVAVRHAYDLANELNRSGGRGEQRGSECDAQKQRSSRCPYEERMYLPVHVRRNSSPRPGPPRRDLALSGAGASCGARL